MTVLSNQCRLLLLLWLTLIFLFGKPYTSRWVFLLCAKEAYLTILVAHLYFGILQICRYVEPSIVWGHPIWYLLQYFTTSLPKSWYLYDHFSVIIHMLILETVYRLTETLFIELVLFRLAFHCWNLYVMSITHFLIHLLPCLRSQKW